MERLLSILIAGIAGVVLGGIVVWFVASAPADNEQPEERSRAEPPEADRPTWEEFDEVSDTLKKLRQEAAQAERALLAAKEAGEEAVAEAARERDEARSRVQELEREVEELKATIEATPVQQHGQLAVPFGKWKELPEVRDADWKAIGGAAHGMIPLLQELAEAMRDGKEPSPTLMNRIGEHNRVLIAYWARIAEKLPTNASMNGEFSHPVNIVNMLAAHLAAAEMPLSDEQKTTLAALGEDYDRRWDAMIARYNENTFALERLLDEGELKEWFKAKMLKVCTPQQRALAVPPAVDGLVGLDLYSAGLIFQMHVSDVRGNDEAHVKELIKARLAATYQLDAAVIENAQFLLNDWILALQSQLTPRPAAEMNQYRTPELLRSGRAQLQAVKVLHSDYAHEESAKEAIREGTAIIYPRVMAQ